MIFNWCLYCSNRKHYHGEVNIQHSCFHVNEREDYEFIVQENLVAIQKRTDYIIR